MKEFLLKKRKILDDENVSWAQVLHHSIVNFFAAFTGGIMMAFIAPFKEDPNLKTCGSLLLAYVIFKQVQSKILNRDKYTTKLGQQYIYPYPSTVGFILGVYITTFL